MQAWYGWHLCGFLVNTHNTSSTAELWALVWDCFVIHVPHHKGNRGGGDFFFSAGCGQHWKLPSELGDFVQHNILMAGHSIGPHRLMAGFSLIMAPASRMAMASAFTHKTYLFVGQLLEEVSHPIYACLEPSFGSPRRQGLSSCFCLCPCAEHNRPPRRRGLCNHSAYFWAPRGQRFSSHF